MCNRQIYCKVGQQAVNQHSVDKLASMAFNGQVSLWLNNYLKSELGKLNLVANDLAEIQTSIQAGLWEHQNTVRAFMDSAANKAGCKSSMQYPILTGIERTKFPDWLRKFGQRQVRLPRYKLNRVGMVALLELGWIWYQIRLSPKKRVSSDKPWTVERDWLPQAACQSAKGSDGKVVWATIPPQFAEEVNDKPMSEFGSKVSGRVQFAFSCLTVSWTVFVMPAWCASSHAICVASARHAPLV